MGHERPKRNVLTPVDKNILTLLLEEEDWAEIQIMVVRAEHLWRLGLLRKRVRITKSVEFLALGQKRLENESCIEFRLSIQGKYRIEALIEDDKAASKSRLNRSVKLLRPRPPHRKQPRPKGRSFREEETLKEG